MTRQNPEALLQSTANTVDLLRNSQVGAYVPESYRAGWRTRHA